MFSDSILVDVRVACNVDEDDSGFDQKLIPLINGQIMMAHQFGVGYDNYAITGVDSIWGDWLGENCNELSAIRTWLGYTVLLLFDPPDNGTVLQSYKDQIEKIEWMLCNKSCHEGYAAKYVPEHESFYERIAEATIDED